MNRLRPTSTADEHSIAGNNHRDVVETAIDRVLAATPETTCA